MSITLEQAKAKLATFGQEHLLKYYDELNEEQKSGLLQQIMDTDLICSYSYKEALISSIY